MISLLPVHMGLQLFPSSPPLSLFRALFLSYLAFSSLSPNNLFYLLSPTISPFLVIVSIPFFCFIFYFSLDGGLGAPALHWGLLLQPQRCWSWSSIPFPWDWCPQHCKRDSPHPNEHFISDIFYISAELCIRSGMQIRSSHMA